MLVRSPPVTAPVATPSKRRVVSSKEMPNASDVFQIVSSKAVPTKSPELAASAIPPIPPKMAAVANEEVSIEPVATP